MVQNSLPTMATAFITTGSFTYILASLTFNTIEVDASI
jgi:hypothetical protein